MKRNNIVLLICLLSLTSCGVIDNSGTNTPSSDNTGGSGAADATCLKNGNIGTALNDVTSAYYYCKGNVNVVSVRGDTLEDFGMQYENSTSCNDVAIYLNKQLEAGQEYKISFELYSAYAGTITLNNEVFNINSGSNSIETNYVHEQDSLPFTLLFGSTSSYMPKNNFSILDLSFSVDGEEEIKENVTGLNLSLKWRDEFNGTELDATKWTYDIGTGAGTVGDGWGNNELQYYRKENAVVADGVLTITAKEETYGPKRFTSSRIKTYGLFDFKYGYAEARMALPSCQGIWPAFWTLGKANNWPYTGEIDIMEAINTENRVFSTLHWNEGNTYNPADYGGGVEVADRTAFHTYGVHWQENYLRFYCDGKLYFSYSIDSTSKKNAFNINHYILLNVAVGGKLPGNSVSGLPQSMQVDYVRVYQ